MANHKHIRLENKAEQTAFESRGFSSSQIVNREAATHSELLRNAYHDAIALFSQRHDVLGDLVNPVAGSYLSFRVNKASMVEDSLDTSSGAQLMNVRPAQDNDQEEQVTVFLPRENSNWFNKKLNEYDQEPGQQIDESGVIKIRNRRNAPLVNAISGIEAAILEDFFTSTEDLQLLGDGREREIEVWFSEDSYNDDEIRTKLHALGIEPGLKSLVFEQVVILLITASARQLVQMIHALKGITEFRLYHSPSVLLNNDEVGSEEWMRLIQSDAQRADDPLVRIAILDTGVNPNHRLLAEFLPSTRCYSVIESGNTKDEENHGTGLASLALYGDLTDVIYDRRRAKITSDLTSVKMLSMNRGEGNREEMYAIITEDAIHVGRESGADILCTAVTDKDHPVSDATASSTSAAIDDTLYNNGSCDSLLLISAGNVGDTAGLDYPDYLYLKSIQDPAQAWNAITVGAYTRKVAIQDTRYRGYRVIAPKDGISPFSSTSVQWGSNAIKPDILMEGGNAVKGIRNTLDAPYDLSLVGADAGNGLAAGRFISINATSAATGLAARLAAKIKYYNRGINALSIRALLIHSAEWTQEMKDLCTENGELNRVVLLHSCGYGVPDEQKAIVSSDNRVTYIAEDKLRPFVLGNRGDRLKFGHMNLYHLPWPKRVLEGLDGEDVRLKITLSYYIKPSPGTRSRLNKYTFQSIRLKFDVKGPQESEADFVNRIKRVTEEGDDNVRDPELRNRWSIGITNRNQGSIISDSFVMNGVEMANCDTIAIFPSGGWFKNRLENLNLEIPYSMVVTLETESEEVMLYNEVESLISNQIIVHS